MNILKETLFVFIHQIILINLWREKAQYLYLISKTNVDHTILAHLGVALLTYILKRPYFFFLILLE